MGAHTSVQLIRPTKPPVITGPDLAQIAWEIANTGLIGHHAGQVVQLRYGKRIDADKKGTVPTGRTAAGNVALPEDYPWDVEQDFGNVDSVLRCLQTHPPALYRAYVSLGELEDSIEQYLTREPHPANPTPMSLSNIALTLDAIIVHGVQIGWIAFTLSGRGSLAPWSPHDLLQRVRELEVVQAIENLLWQRWPVNEAPGLFERMALKKVRDRTQPMFPARPGWIWAVSND
jgi:hypothetical protein